MLVLSIASVTWRIRHQSQDVSESEDESSRGCKQFKRRVYEFCRLRRACVWRSHRIVHARHFTLRAATSRDRVLMDESCAVLPAAVSGDSHYRNCDEAREETS